MSDPTKEPTSDTQDTSAATPEDTNAEAEVKIEEVDQAEGDAQEIPVDVADAAEDDKEPEIASLTLEDAMEVIANMQVDLRQARSEAKEATQHAVRLQADFQNYRRRQEKEQANTVRFANEDLVKQLLPILDNFDRTLDAMEKTDNLSAIKDGISMVDKSMRKQLTKIGLEPIVAKGKPFDSALHEAITAIPVEDEAQKDKVLEEVEKGYKLKDRVLRYAKVVVGE